MRDALEKLRPPESDEDVEYGLDGRDSERYAADVGPASLAWLHDYYERLTEGRRPEDGGKPSEEFINGSDEDDEGNPLYRGALSDSYRNDTVITEDLGDGIYLLGDGRLLDDNKGEELAGYRKGDVSYIGLGQGKRITRASEIPHYIMDLYRKGCPTDELLDIAVTAYHEEGHKIAGGNEVWASRVGLRELERQRKHLPDSLYRSIRTGLKNQERRDKAA